MRFRGPCPIGQHGERAGLGPAPTGGHEIQYGSTDLCKSAAPTALRELPAQIGTHTVSHLCVGAAISRPPSSLTGTACTNWDPSSPIPA